MKLELFEARRLTPTNLLPVFSGDLSLSAARRGLAQALEEASKEPAQIEAALLVGAATGLDRLTLIAGPDRALGAEAALALTVFAARRLGGEPVSRIIGASGFFGLDLIVAPDVLDPRADTENLVEVALALLADEQNPEPLVVDLGVGSGAILCAILQNAPRVRGVGVDLSPAACAAAQRNLTRCGLDGRGRILRGRWSQALRGPFDLVVSNPPYIAQAELAELDAEVVEFDPPLALDGGLDGFDAYRAIIADLDRILRPGGAVVFEIGWRQGEAVAALLENAGFPSPAIGRDLAGRERTLAARRPKL